MWLEGVEACLAALDVDVGDDADGVEWARLDEEGEVELGARLLGAPRSEFALVALLRNLAHHTLRQRLLTALWVQRRRQQPTLGSARGESYGPDSGT